MSFVECRICLVPTGGSNMISVQAKVMDKKNVLQAIEEVVSIQSSENDCLPKYICKKCFKLLKSMVVFRRLIVSSYEIFQKRLNQTHLETSLEIKMEAFSEPPLILCFDEKNIVEDSNPIYSNNLQEDMQNYKPEIKLDDNFKKNVCSRYKRITQKKISSSAICKTKTRKIYNIKRKENTVVEITKTDQTSSASRNTSQMCNVCEKMITGRQKYNAHMRMHNKQVPPPLIYFCSVCPKKFSEKRYLVIHRRVHTGEKPYHCDICNKNFSQFSSFSLHKRRMHDKIIQGTCSYCGKKFVDKPELDVHIRMWHTGERPYLCEFCSATFVCNRTLQRHRKELHSEKKPCQKCGKMFGDYAMKKHLVRHQVLEEGLKIMKKKYTCEYCKTVMNFTSRRRHLEKQHGIKLFGRGDDCTKIPINEATE